ncbi:MAG: glycosyltransferase [Deltaproteobacteria bacterium]|nr:glycosyltransferase [Deltaproteobacteria bacterium]
MTDESYEKYRQDRRLYWDRMAVMQDQFKAAAFYRRRLIEIYRSAIPPGKRVIEIGCGKGDLLAALDPSFGVGLDFSGSMIKKAQSNYPELRFIVSDAHEIKTDDKFDYVIMSDLLNDLWDVQEVLEKIQLLTNPSSRIIVNFYSRVWQPPLTLVRWLGLAKPVLQLNWLTVEDVSALLELTNYEPIHKWQEILLPIAIPALSHLSNRYLVKVWPFRAFALTNFLVARPIKFGVSASQEKPLVSVIIPARNEEGNIPTILKRVPEMGAGTELVFVEGHSQDNTYSAIEKAIQENLNRRCKLSRQQGKGKGDAVRFGFELAEGSVLMILDADLTVPPESLPRFYDALVSGKGEFINGVRLVYPMEDRAMRFLNILGNRFFSLAFSWLLGQPIKDTLCGTKVLFRDDYNRIAENRQYFGDFDPFGDFDLIFGAAKQNLKIVDLPVRYRERTYGSTNIQRWTHGLLLLKMVAFACRKLKFI